MVPAQSDQIFKGIVETIREPLLVLNQDLRVVTVSHSFYEFFKVTPEETVGQLIYDLGNKQWDIPKLRELLENILPEKTAFDNYEVEHDFASIGRRTMLLNARQIEQVMGKERIILLAFEDITERKRLEDLLADSEERYRRLFETADDGILLLDKHELKIRHANPAITATLGYASEDCIGKDLRDIGVSDDIGTVNEIMQTLNEDGILYFQDFPIQNKTGQVVDTDIYMVDRASLVQCNIRDITERKRMEISLLENEERYRLLTENSLTGIYIHVEGLLKFVNSRFAEILGYAPEELVGQQYWDFVHPEDREMVKSISLARARGETPPSEYEFRHQSKAGETVWVHNLASIIQYQGQTANIGNLAQINDRKQAETEKRILENQLRHSQQLESIGTLAGGIAHDFNNILTSVIGYTELALDKVEKETSLEDYLQEVHTAGKRARDLVKQMLTFARQTEEEVKPIQVDIIVKEVLKFIRSSLPTTIEIKQDIKSDSLIMGNSAQVHQIMMNLCTNAAHAMKDDIGVLEINLEDVQIDNGFLPPEVGLQVGDYIKLSVSDTGTGISPRVIGQIFAPYFTTKDIGEGTGMGLSMVHGIVESYGGKITVNSELGKGTTFSVYLPKTKERKALRTYQKEELPSGVERILFVDDEVPITKMGRQVLENLGYSVTTRTSSVEALELFLAKPNAFDLVITDMTMPNMTGDKLAFNLMKVRLDIPVILCTGYSKNISDETASKIGIKALVYKPIVKADFAKTVRKVLDEAKG